MNIIAKLKYKNGTKNIGIEIDLITRFKDKKVIFLFKKENLGLGDEDILRDGVAFRRSK